MCSDRVTRCSWGLLVQVVTHTFSQHIEDARAADPAWEESVAAVMSVIKAGLKRWKPLDNIPGANSFTYEEESEQPQAFFVPYCWTLVISGTTIPFNLPFIALFSAVPDIDERLSDSERTVLELGDAQHDI